MSDAKTAHTYNDSWGTRTAQCGYCRHAQRPERHHSNSMIFKAACFGRGRLPMSPRTLPFALMIGTLVAI